MKTPYRQIQGMKYIFGNVEWTNIIPGDLEQQYFSHFAADLNSNKICGREEWNGFASCSVEG